MLGVINTVGIKQDEPMQRPALAELFGAVFWATVASLPSDPQAQRVWTASETGAAHGHPFGFSLIAVDGLAGGSRRHAGRGPGIEDGGRRGREGRGVQCPAAPAIRQSD